MRQWSQTGPLKYFIISDSVFIAAIKQLLFAADDTGIADISAVACCTLKKLLSECQKLFTCRDVCCSTPVESFHSSLATDLNKGLLSALDKNHYSPSCTKLYASSSVRLVYLFFGFYFKPETDREFKFICRWICQNIKRIVIQSSDTVGWASVRTSGL